MKMKNKKIVTNIIILQIVLLSSCNDVDEIALSSNITTMQSGTDISYIPLTDSTSKSNSIEDDMLQSSGQTETDKLPIQIQEEKYMTEQSIGYWYKNEFCSQFPIISEEHIHNGTTSDIDTVGIVYEKLLSAQKIYNVLIGNVPRENTVTDTDNNRPISNEYSSIDEIVELCEDTFAKEVRDYGYSFSDTVPEELYWLDENSAGKTIHKYLTDYIETRTINGMFCPDPFYCTNPIVYRTEICDINQIDSSNIECTICSALRIEENTTLTDTDFKTIFTHSKAYLKCINNHWYITTLEFPIYNIIK